MHTLAGSQKIRDLWSRPKKWYWPEPLSSLGDYLKEGKHLPKLVQKVLDARIDAHLAVRRREDEAVAHDGEHSRHLYARSAGLESRGEGWVALL